MIDFKGSQFEREIILWGVRWYVAYPISYRQLEEMMGERGVAVDHSALHRWVIKYAPEFEKQFRRRQRSVGRSWRMDESVPRTHSQSTGMRCYIEDEGRPLGAGVQAQASNHLKLQRSRAAVVSVKEKADPRVCQVKSTETSGSEPSRTCRKALDDVKTGGSFVIPGAVWEGPVYCPHGVRHRGGVTVLWASVWNVGTCRSAAKGEPQVGSPHEWESTEAEHRDGAACSRGEGPVMGLDRRGCIVRGCSLANRQREEPCG
jgi:hypothetical protein